MYISRSLIKHLHCIHSRKLVIPVGSCARIKMQAREVGQICTQNINKSIRLFYYCNPTFFATKATTLSLECPLQEGPKNFSRRQNQISASYVHNLLPFLVLHYTHICFSSFPSSSQVSWMLRASILVARSFSYWRNLYEKRN